MFASLQAWIADPETPKLLSLLPGAMLDTLIMVAIASVIGFIVGTVLGVILHQSKLGGIYQNAKLNLILGWVVNVGRSIPFLILMVALVPFTRFVVGTSIGTAGAVVPLTIGIIPFIARLIEGALMEVPSGLVEAAKAMGASKFQIICKVLLPEALPGIINALTITLITLISYSAMAGTVGGGGIGDYAVNYGYYRSQHGEMVVAIILLIILVQLVQSLGDYLVRRVDHR
ncbi:D-methionine transport system permease protein MetI [Vibrio stylophorae]|uniref:D-methionine transport system permease protein MetI n=1 Tax=Vibrio stylophorae TaxID=659351 RepID=A0ABM8ZV56_9VIBR|nr:methionine ABC transporter permease [Vibrio stylophorae]CAH0534209.1 D-methionine transport system permease protein MetI [Vibrio stylophorae]